MKPSARRNNIFTERLAEEVVLYDKANHKAHCLNATVAAVWEHSDGERTVSDLTRILHENFGIPQDRRVVLLALEQLDKAGLMEPASMDVEKAPSRRQVARRLAIAGVSASLIPLVASVVAPTPAMASSPGEVYTPAEVTRDLQTLENEIASHYSAYMQSPAAQADLTAGLNATGQGIFQSGQGNASAAQADFTAAEADFNAALKALGLPPL